MQSMEEMQVYKVEKISLGEDIEKISATKVRKSMNITYVSCSFL